MQNPEPAKATNDAPPILVARDIVKSFDEITILKGISLEIAQGDLVSIIGPSGCGKSTFLRCLNLLEVPDSGTVTVDGITITRTGGNQEWDGAAAASARALRTQVGMVFQSFNLFPHRTLLDNVMLAPMVVKGESRKSAEERALELLTKVRLSNFVERYPAQLSGGQQQRAAIARALAMAPKVMLYDEPTSALDPELVDEVLQVMRDLDKDGMTQIVVTHEMRFAREASDYIVFMQGGEIVEISDEDEIFDNPKDPRTRQFLRRFAPEARPS
ncbi:MAG: amino acid ABC transporter ATP-binding protein [Candidatus Binataceae bacterium]